VTPPRLLACTPPTDAVDDDAVLRWRDAGALELGLALWLREPGASPRELVVGRLRPLLVRARAAGVPIVLGVGADAIDEAAVIVEAEGLAGVQLRGDPGRDALVRARERLPAALVGRSCHDASAGDHELVDFTCFGPVFGPRTRTAGDDKRPQGVGELAICAAAPHAWVLAIGGVHGGRAADCIAAGAVGIAGISSFFAAEHRRGLAAFVAALQPRG
jgi:thiamine-phosphate pyrophosphorylase